MTNSCTHTWERNSDGTFKVFRNGVGSFDECGNYRKPYVDIERLAADDITQLRYGTLMVQNGDLYSLYATKKYTSKYSQLVFGDVVKFIDGISEYHSFGDVILFRTAEGWFFLFSNHCFTNIHHKHWLEEKIKKVPKLCEADTQILECKCIELAPIDHYSTRNGYMVTTSEGKFLLYHDPSEGECHGYAIPITRYSKIPGYEWTVKIYPNASRKFFLAPLKSEFGYNCPNFAWNKPDLVQKITYLGNGYMLAKNGKKSKLFFCHDGIQPFTVVDWGVYEITNVESQYDKLGDHILRTKWSVNDGKSTQIVEYKSQLSWWSIPELKR